MKKLAKFLIICLNIFFISTNLKASQKIQILYKIDNTLVTNIDINNELNYLTSLNTNLKNLKKDEIYDIAKESLLREKIKLNEIKKFFLIENYENNPLIDNILKNLYTKINLNDLNEFKIYLSDFDITINEVIEKLKIEILWNQLIVKKFQDQININENEIRQKIKDNKINYREIIEYDLSEIVLAPQNKLEFNEKLKKVIQTINSFGFETAANKFSVSDTSKLGGNIGKVKENQIAENIKEEIKELKINEFSKPIFVNNNYIIIKVNQKKIINEEYDEDKIVNEMIQTEKDKQYQNFSQIYFNKIKLNTQINEF